MPDNGFSNASADPVAPCALAAHWIEIELKDDDGNPVPNEAYKITLPSGEANTGFLDGDGFARLEGMANAGVCQVTFPNIDNEEWEFQSSTSQKPAPATSGT